MKRGWESSILNKELATGNQMLFVRESEKEKKERDVHFKNLVLCVEFGWNPQESKAAFCW